MKQSTDRSLYSTGTAVHVHVLLKVLIGTSYLSDENQSGPFVHNSSILVIGVTTLGIERNLFRPIPHRPLRRELRRGSDEAADDGAPGDGWNGAGGLALTSLGEFLSPVPILILHKCEFVLVVGDKFRLSTTHEGRTPGAAD